jgi:RNA polymerase sigma-70 factor (ECF subfamily)
MWEREIRETSETTPHDAATLRLVRRAQTGDRGAFAELYQRHFDDVYRYLRVILGHGHDAEDATQQVFLSVLAALPRYTTQPDSRFEAWLFRIARNEALDRLRRGNRLEIEEPEQVERRVEDTGALPPPTALAWISDADLMIFVERLPLAQRQALVLRHLMGLGTEQIADVLGKSPDATRRLEHRALTFLRERLAAVGRDSRRHIRAPIRARTRLVPVIRARRFALHYSRPANGARF